MYQRDYSRFRKATIETVLDLQSIGAELRIYGEIDDPQMRYFNPSIAWHDDKLMIAIRSCNFAVEPKGKWYFRDGSAYSKTDVIYGDVNPDSLEVNIYANKLSLSKDAPINTQLAGLEDVRLFQRGKDLYAIGYESDRITRSLHNESASLAVYSINNNQLNYHVTLNKPEKNAVEKNWCPPDVESKHFDFTYSPSQIVKDGRVIGEKYSGDIHGGTQLLKQKDGTYLSIVHKKTLNRMLNRPGVYDKYVYYHYLASHSKEGYVTHLTKPFTFGTLENIEFAAGMVQHDLDLIISFGIRDCKFALCRIDKKKLVGMLEVV